MVDYVISDQPGANARTEINAILAELIDRNTLKNYVDNGGFTIWQRGTSFAASGTAAYTADRWETYQVTGPHTVSRQTGGNSQYCIRVARDAAATNVNIIYLDQSKESDDVRHLAGAQVTLSFRARSGANFSAASAHLVSRISTGTGTDENRLTAGYTGGVDQEQNNVLTTSFQTFTHTVTLAAGAAEVSVSFYFTPVGTAGAADYVEIEQVKLERGETATAFEHESIADTLARCQRYYQNTSFYSAVTQKRRGSAGATGAEYHWVEFPAPMRTTATVTLSSITNTNTTGGAAASPAHHGFEFNHTISIAGGDTIFHYQADAEL